MILKKNKIISNKKVQARRFKLIFTSPEIAKKSLPGQFVNIRVSDALQPLLRRPLSIHRVLDKNKIELLYEIVGPATEILSRKKPEEFLDVIGPLGNGFNLSAKRSTLNAILVAGGMGVAPLIFLAEKLTDNRPKTKDHRPIVLIGAKTKNHILCEKEFKNFGCGVKISTDDGSLGFKGYVSDLLKKTLWTIDHRPLTIYACGPKPMLKEIADISKKFKIPAQVSLEEHMACGIGACMGCAVKTKSGYKRVCKDGPVFDAGEIVWD